MQRDGPAEALLRGAGPRVAEQAAAGADRPPRPLLRPAEAAERRGTRRPRRQRSLRGEEPAAGRRLAGEGERGLALRAHEDEALHHGHPKERLRHGHGHGHDRGHGDVF